MAEYGLRRAFAATQEELAFRVSLNRTYISLLERSIKSPTLKAFFHLCKVLNQQPTEAIVQVHERIMQGGETLSKGREKE